MAEQTLHGRFQVQRRSGLLPPFGVSKVIREGRGVTRLFGIPVAPFRVFDRELVYRLLPIRDVLAPNGDGTFSGEGLLFGKRFCTFFLNPKGAQP